MSEESRTPVSIAVNDSGKILIVCDDGTVWEGVGLEWQQRGSPIPGTQADKSS